MRAHWPLSVPTPHPPKMSVFLWPQWWGETVWQSDFDWVVPKAIPDKPSHPNGSIHRMCGTCGSNPGMLWNTEKRAKTRPKKRTTRNMQTIIARKTQRARRGILMPRGKNCGETIFAAQLPHNYPHHGGNFGKKKKCPLLWGRGNLGGILWDTLGEGNWESKLPRDNGESIFAARHQDVSQGPLEIESGWVTLSGMALGDLDWP